MQSNRLILGLIVLTLSVSGMLAWQLFGATQQPRGFALPRAEIQDASADLADAQIPDNPQRRVPAAPISKGKAVSATVLGVNRVQYYDPDNGKVWEVTPTGAREQLISPTLLPSFMETVWSPNKHEVISRFKTGQGIVHKYFDYTTKRSVSMGNRIQSFAFSPDGSKIAYFTVTEGMGEIYLAYPDGQEQKRIFTTRLTNLELMWPSESILAFTTREPISKLTSLFTLGLEGKLEKKFDSVEGLEARWSPDGSRVLISFFTPDGILTTVYLDDDRVFPVQARASECVWAESTILVCAVSQTPISMAVVETGAKTPVDFYEIDLKNFSKKLLYSSGVRSADASVGQILATPGGETILFINRYDGKLYSFKR